MYNKYILIKGRWINVKPLEALNILDKAVSQLSARREVHVGLQQAITVLRDAISPKPEAIKPKEEKANWQNNITMI